MIKLDINTKEVIAATSKLEGIRSSALPLAVRLTLNKAAFDTKKEVPNTASKNFITRNKSFFRFMTLVDMVSDKGNINNMESRVGINTRKFPALAERLEVQELGGVLDRSMVPMKQARTSGSNEKRVKRANYLSSIRIPSTRKRGAGTGFIMIKKGNKGTVFQIKKGKKSSLTPLYSFEKNRNVKIKKVSFMEQSAQDSIQELPKNFVEQAERLIQRYTR